MPNLSPEDVNDTVTGAMMHLEMASNFLGEILPKAIPHVVEEERPKWERLLAKLSELREIMQKEFHE